MCKELLHITQATYLGTASRYKNVQKVCVKQSADSLILFCSAVDVPFALEHSQYISQYTLRFCVCESILAGGFLCVKSLPFHVSVLGTLSRFRISTVALYCTTKGVSFKGIPINSFQCHSLGTTLSLSHTRTLTRLPVLEFLCLSLHGHDVCSAPH